ncbi:MAG TPA: DUF2752 domain-containing protein [Chthoniobacterales bacterium]|jgi:hypothetical protein|nr:DUF2752 domain-containing protein [Chthoniobacterales bacterium]
MRIVRRPLAPGELDYEFVWLSVTMTALAMAAVWFALGLPWPHCAFLTLTGHPCLTCGATRCTIAFFHFDFVSALKWNPLVFAFLCALSIFDAYAAIVLVLRGRRLRVVQFTLSQKKFIRVAAILLLLSNWIYLLSRPRGLF